VVEIARTSSERIDLEDTLKLILKNAVEALKGNAGVVATWSEAERRFVAQVSYGLDPVTMAQLQPLLNEAAPDLAASKESFDLLSELRPGVDLPYSEKGVTQNPIIALPLQIGGRSIGLIYVLRPADAPAFSHLDQPILTAFAEQAAIAVQNAKLTHVLAEEKHGIELILETSADGIITVDARRRLTGFNRAMEELTGYSREEVLGKECFTLLQLRDWEGKNLCPVQCPFLTDTKNGGQSFELQGKMRTKHGRDTDVSIIYSIIRTPEGKTINAVGNIRDISRNRQLENLRETFLAMLGHELQTPLSIIKGYTSTLARTDGKWDKETLQNGLQIIEEESDRLGQVVNKLLLASRISTGTSVLRKELIEPSAIADKVVRRLQKIANKHTFEVNFDSTFPPVPADPELIENVLANLVENAIKYSPGGGKISISGSYDAKKTRITISDEGIGIPPEEIEHIFERFHRVDKGPARAVRGLGLGLYLCKTIIEAHGGTIEVSSQMGKGSQFTFSLPL
jgi:PAS domain S-box-containing protein